MATTWILVGDASRARIFAFDKEDGPWVLVAEIDHPPGRARTSDLVTDRAGRQREIGPPLEGRTDPAEQESHRFAEKLGHLVGKGFDEHRYARLLLVAPPRFLGYLRGVLREPVLRHVVRSTDKDYTHHEVRELRRLLDFPPERK